MLWEEQVALLKEGYHKELVRTAYESDDQTSRIYPPRTLVFNAMRSTPFSDVRVVILGQDPYFNEHPELGPEAHGLCFSVREGVPAPPSLKNIFKEIDRSLYNGQPRKVSTDLTRWATQGVLLLNASLTVVAKKPNSHANIGWHKLTDDIIHTISTQKRDVVFMLWGAFAQKKSNLIDEGTHLVLKTSHPSPLSAHRGFLGSNIFVTCNKHLVENGFLPIDW